MKPFLLITTGGTIDKVYDPIQGKLVFQGSSIPKVLEELGIRKRIEHIDLFRIDSLEMTDEQRREIAKVCRESEYERIMITHGTDTMVETAQAIAAEIPKGTRVVLTGAMVPLSIKGSDGVFHLGLSLAYLQEEGAGVYISMHGELFSSSSCRKDRELGRFVSLK